jgi:hypothetical protein
MTGMGKIATVHLMRKLFQIAIAFGLVGLSSCSRDTPISSDYALYDLDGSNQAIIGHGGTVALHNVTGYATERSLIFVEIGPEGEGFENPTPGCSYRIIDVSKNIVSMPIPQTANYHMAVAAIRAQRKGFVSRSCSRVA